MIIYALDTNIVSYFLKNDVLIVQKIIEDDDLLIAAYCINLNLPLVTNNTKHFINMERLKILNWVE